MNRRRVFGLGVIVGMLVGATSRNYVQQWIADYDLALSQLRREDSEYCRCGAHVVGTPCYSVKV